MGNYEQALSYRTEQLEVFKEHLGVHPFSSISLYNVGKVYTKMKKYKEAIRYFNLSYQMNMRLYGKTVKVLKIGFIFGKTCLQDKQYRRGTKLLEKVTSDAMKLLSERTETAECCKLVSMCDEELTSISKIDKHDEHLKQLVQQKRSQQYQCDMISVTNQFDFGFGFREAIIVFLLLCIIYLLCTKSS